MSTKEKSIQEIMQINNNGNAIERVKSRLMQGGESDENATAINNMIIGTQHQEEDADVIYAQKQNLAEEAARLKKIQSEMDK